MDWVLNFEPQSRIDFPNNSGIKHNLVASPQNYHNCKGAPLVLGINANATLRQTK